jgi:hypothetical protein
MSSTSSGGASGRRSGREVDDDRPEAVAQADMGAAAWRAAVHAQQGAAPDHTDFYSLAGSLADTLAAVESLAELLARQVAGYAATAAATGGQVYDDTREVDPEARLYAAAERAAHVAAAAATAERRVQEFWSAIGHIGVEPAGGTGAAGVTS